MKSKKKMDVCAIVESRCGILCGACGYREQMGCKGCVHIEKPFWGDSCPVKACCEDKGHEHCRQCGEFPCALLNQFAYDERQGDGCANCYFYGSYAKRYGQNTILKTDKLTGPSGEIKRGNTTSRGIISSPPAFPPTSFCPRRTSGGGGGLGDDSGADGH